MKTRGTVVQLPLLSRTFNSCLSCSTPASLMPFSSSASSSRGAPAPPALALARPRATARAPGRVIWLQHRSTTCACARQKPQWQQVQVVRSQHTFRPVLHKTRGFAASASRTWGTAQQPAATAHVCADKSQVANRKSQVQSCHVTCSDGSVARPRDSVMAPSSSNSFSRRFSLQPAWHSSSKTRAETYCSVRLLVTTGCCSRPCARHANALSTPDIRPSRQR